MSITRVSLYEHELEAVGKLTMELTRLRQDECKHLCVENVGPEIFGKLVAILYGEMPQLLKQPSPDWLQQMEGIAPGGIIKGGHP
jgi:hypothetical protein